MDKVEEIRDTVKVQKQQYYNCSQEIPNYNCKSCTYGSPYKVELCKHIKEGCNIQKRQDYRILKKENCTQYECIHCSYKTFNKTHWNRHIVFRHTPQEEIKWYDCNDCSYKSKTAYGLEKHQKTHNREKCTQYKCEFCPFKTFGRSNLRNHILCKHTPDTNINWYKCDQCDYKCKIFSRLTSHKVIHNRENAKQFICEYCGFVTRRKQQLNSHVLFKHTRQEDINWRQCDLCSLKFKTTFELNRHKRTHKE